MIEIVLCLIGLGIIIALIIIIVQNTKKKWKCIDGKCESDINGEYTSETNCKNNCKEKTTNTILKKESEENNFWACSKDNKCIPSPQGIYTSAQACKSNCKETDTVSTINYYPQSMIPVWRSYPGPIWPHRRPHYWPYPRSHRPHRPRSPGKGRRK